MLNRGAVRGDARDPEVAEDGRARVAPQRRRNFARDRQAQPPSRSKRTVSASVAIRID